MHSTSGSPLVDRRRSPRLVALTGAVGLLASSAVMGFVGSAAADEVPCGTPARDAVYETVRHPATPPLFETVVVTPERTEQRVVTPGEGAVTETEYGWSHDQNPPEGDGWEPTGETKNHVTRDASDGSDAEGYYVYEWTRQVLIADPWTETVERETPLYAFVHKNPDHPQSPRYDEDPKWNANWNPNSFGWTRATELDMLTETIEHPAEYKTETEKSATKPEGDGWEKTGEKEWVETKPGSDPVEEESHLDYEFERTIVVTPGKDAVYETVTVPAVTEQRKVTDAVPAWSEEVLVSPATPAGPPCEDEVLPEGGEVEEDTAPAPADEGSDEDGNNDDDGVRGVVSQTPPPSNEPGSEVLGSEQTSSPVSVPTAVDAGLGSVTQQAPTSNTAANAMTATGFLALLFAAWNHFGRRARSLRAQ